MHPSLKVYTACALLVTLLFSTAATTSDVPSASKPMPPNIIILLVDDAGYADFGFMGSKDLQTPNLDQLAAHAIRFTDAHVTATVCSPSRAGLLTGKYQQRFGYECNEGEHYPGMDTAQVIIPKLLLQKGYKTAAIGKWHLGFEPAQQPLQKGFQYFYGFLSGSRSYFYQPDKDDSPGSKSAVLQNNKPVKFDGYLTDVLAQKTVAFIRQNKNNPFFIYWAPNAVHTPMEASKEDLAKFANHPRQKLAAMTFALDRAVGSITDELKKQGIFDNTLLIFLSDNGGAANNQSSNGSLKGFKGNNFEGGQRIPFFVCWPKNISGNKSFTGITSSLDIFPTVLEAAGITNKPSYALDGVSLLQYLNGEKKGNPHEELVWRKDKAAAIRNGPYKLLQIQGAGDRLYNLKNDPGETADLQTARPEIYTQMKQQFADWEKDKMQPLWTEGAEWDTITLMIHDDLMHNRKVRVSNPEQLKKFRSQKKP